MSAAAAQLPNEARADGRCFYCDAPLSPRHELDHFPLPRRAGGTVTVATCVNCHDLKDRISVDDYLDRLDSPIFGELSEAFGRLSPAARIFIAKAVGVWFDRREASE